MLRSTLSLRTPSLRAARGTRRLRTDVFDYVDFTGCDWDRGRALQPSGVEKQEEPTKIEALSLNSPPNVREA